MGAPGGRKAAGGNPALVGLFVGLLLLAPGSAAAGQITVDKLNVILGMHAGEAPLGVLNIRNDGDRAVQVMISMHDWDRDLDGTNQWHPQGSVAGSCGPAVGVFPATALLPPGATQAIRITLDSTFQPGRECWTAAIIETVAPPSVAGVGVVHRLRTATKIYIQPPGVAPIGAVEALRVGVLPIRGDSVRAVEMTVANTGTRHLEGAGELQIRTPDGRVLQTLKLPTAYVLGGARMRVRAPFPDLPAGRYVLLAILDYRGAELAAGQAEYVVP